MIRIPKPRGITTVQLMVVTLIGFGGGIYIWKPLFLSLRSQQSDGVSSAAVASPSTTATNN